MTPLPVMFLDITDQKSIIAYNDILTWTLSRVNKSISPKIGRPYLFDFKRRMTPNQTSKQILSEIRKLLLILDSIDAIDKLKEFYSQINNKIK